MAVSSKEDFGLKRLFRPALDSLSIQEQLPYYSARNLTQSRCSRLGSSRPTRTSPQPRKRIIDASLYSPNDKDDEIQGSTACRLTFKRRDLFPKHEQRYQSPQLPAIPTNAFDDNNFPDVLTPDNYHEYKDWISERKALRNSLDSMGLSKSWLCGKERNPLEGKALRSLLQAEKKKQGDTDMLRQLLEMEEVNPKVSAPLPPKPPSPPPPKMPTALPKLESFLEGKHLRLLDFFKRMDKNKDWLVTVDDLQSVVKQYDIPVTEKECTKLFSSIETKKKGEMSYKELLRGISKWTSKLNRSSSHLSRIRDQDLEAMEEEDCAEKDDDSGDSTETRSSPVVESVSDGPLSTMEGMAGEGDIRYKVKLQQQFNDVCKLFEEEGLVMEKTLLERALLLPEDCTREECIERLSSDYSSSLLSQHHLHPRSDTSESRRQSRFQARQSFGGAYLEMRGPARSRKVKLSTGRARIRSKTDCWMSFEEYIKFARQHQPLYPYKYQKPSSSSVFWPGALLNKLRLCLDSNQKTNTMRNIFQPVGEETTSSSVKPAVCGWPQNEAGYVQFGTIKEKRCVL